MLVEPGHPKSDFEAQLAARDAIIEAQRVEIEQLKVMVADLLAKLCKNSSNSSLPPSSDGPGARRHGRFTALKP